jgi:hypothetical protein
MAHDHVLPSEPGSIGFFSLMADALGSRRGRATKPAPSPAADARPATPAPAPDTPSGFTSALRLMTEAEARDYDTVAFKPTSRYFGTYAESDPDAAKARAKTALWMGVGYVGTAAALVGALRIIDGTANPLQTAVYAVAGALVAFVAFRGAWRTIVRGR